MLYTQRATKMADTINVCKQTTSITNKMAAEFLFFVKINFFLLFIMWKVVFMLEENWKNRSIYRQCETMLHVNCAPIISISTLIFTTHFIQNDQHKCKLYVLCKCIYTFLFNEIEHGRL